MREGWARVGCAGRREAKALAQRDAAAVYLPAPNFAFADARTAPT